jgi:hypothetical protein
VTELSGVELFEEVSLFPGVGGLVVYMLFVMYRPAWGSSVSQ